MNITLESIDELRLRADVGYKEAKEALVECDGEMVDAMIYIEEKFGVKNQEKIEDKKGRANHSRRKENGSRGSRKNVDGFSNQIHKVIDYCNTTRFVIFNKYRTVIDIPLSLAILIGMIFNVFAIIIMVTAIVTDHKIKLVRKDDSAKEINTVIDKVQQAAKEVSDSIKTTVNLDK